MKKVGKNLLKLFEKKKLCSYVGKLEKGSGHFVYVCCKWKAGIVHVNVL